MASNGQKEKMGDDALAGNGKPTDLDIEGDNHNAETYDQDHGEEDVAQTDDVPKKPNQRKDRCLRRDEEVKEMANKLADLQSVVNFMMQNNVMQPPFPLHDTPVPKNNTQKGGQISIAPRHNKSRRHSHQTSREIGRGESRREESQRTRHTKEADPKEHRDV
ncbi:hypothetical protein ACSBR1_011595 [Camellia fascicularis]